MIAVISDNQRLQVTIPTEGLTSDEINAFLVWLRVESVVRHSKLTPDAAWQLSEEIKAGWWRANEPRFSTPEAG